MKKAKDCRKGVSTTVERAVMPPIIGGGSQVLHVKFVIGFQHAQGWIPNHPAESQDEKITSKKRKILP